MRRFSLPSSGSSCAGAPGTESPTSESPHLQHGIHPNFLGSERAREPSVTGRIRERLRSYSRCIAPQKLVVEEQQPGRQPPAAPSALESPLGPLDPGDTASVCSAGTGSDFRRDYVYQSPRMTIRDTNEQIKRNSSGTFGSLGEFAQHHQMDTRGKVFAHCAETGDVWQPTIDLDLVNSEQHSTDRGGSRDI